MNTQNKQNRRSVGMVVMGLVYLAAGGAMGILMAKYTIECGLDFLSMYALTMAVFVIAMVVSTALHESGHLVGGLLSGYRFACFRLFALNWRRGQDGRIHIGLLKTPGMGGQCLMSPPPLKDGKMPFMLYHAGGALMNLLFAVVFAAAALLVGREQYVTAQVLGMEFLTRVSLGAERAAAVLSLWIFAIMNMAAALTNGIPLKNHLISNDGQNMIDLRRSPDALRRHWADMNIAAGIWQGERLKDMPEEWFSCPSDGELRQNGMDAGTAMMYYSRLMDEAGENEQCLKQAISLSDRLLSDGVQLAGLHRALLRMDRAFMEMLVDTPLEYVRREKIAEWLDAPTKQVMKAMKKGLTVQRIEYAQVLLIEKDEEKAQKIKAQFDKAARRYPVLTDVESEKSLMRLVEQTRERRKAQEISQQ